MTIATILIDPSETRLFGVVDVDSTGQVVGFQEKPEQTDLRSPYDSSLVSASMGVYLFNTEVLIPALLKDAEDPTSRHDFGHNILPRMVDDYKVYSFNFIDENKKEALYWRDVGTLEAYYEANMDLVSVAPVFNLYDKAWPIRTHMRQYPPAKFVFNDPGALERRTTRLFPWAASSPAALCAIACYRPMCGSIPTRKLTPASCSPT